jgi:hypothetical protein
MLRQEGSMKRVEPKATTEGKLTEEGFTLRAIDKLANKERSKGIHCVYSGFNSAWKNYFNTDPKQGVTALADRGIVKIRPCKGGVMIYRPEDYPKTANSTGATTLKKMGL